MKGRKRGEVWIIKTFIDN